MICHKYKNYQRPSLLVCILLFLILYFTHSEDEHHFKKRGHVLTNFTDNEAIKLSRYTNSSIIKDLLRPILVPRIVGTPEHEKVGQYLKQKVEEYGFYTEWDKFVDQTPNGSKSFQNLIATFEPEVSRRLVLACHYDSKIMPGQVFIGAIDAAVPCALVLDIARTLSPLIKHRIHKNITLQLIFFDGEEAFDYWTDEDSIYGARHLADIWERKPFTSSNKNEIDMKNEIDRIDMLVLLDLLGANKTKTYNTEGHGTTEFFNQLIKIEKRLKSLNLINPIYQIFNTETFNGMVEDDHMPFLKKEVPILHLISMPFPKVWHTVRDNESALDYKAIENISTILRVFVAEYLGIKP